MKPAPFTGAAYAVAIERGEHAIVLWNRIGTGDDDPLDYVVVATFLGDRELPFALVLTAFTPGGSGAVDPVAWALLNLRREDLARLSGEIDTNSAIEVLGRTFREGRTLAPWVQVDIEADGVRRVAGQIITDDREVLAFRYLPIACHIPRNLSSDVAATTFTIHQTGLEQIEFTDGRPARY